MSLSRLYYDHPLPLGCQVELDTKLSQHILHVLRLKKHAPLILFNGQGGEFIAELIDIKKHRAIVKLLEHREGLPNPTLSIHLGQALSKGQRMDYALQKATELGVSAITPLYTKHGNVQIPPSRLNNRLSHWKGIITHASAQSKRCDIPQLTTPEDFTNTSLLKNDGIKLICTVSSHNFIQSMSTAPSKVILLIGPEGGFTPEEVTVALDNGFQRFSLGPRTLRTETATVVALSVIQTLWGDLTENTR
jgi:16S rRNA (uracil1498-N3)-methyltransferase